MQEVPNGPVHVSLIVPPSITNATMDICCLFQYSDDGEHEEGTVAISKTLPDHHRVSHFKIFSILFTNDQIGLCFYEINLLS